MGQKQQKADYFFPGLIDTLNLPDYNSDAFQYTVASGESAVQLILKSYNLSANSIVALPAYVCDVLKKPVLKEGMTTLYLDLKPESFWTEYDMDVILKNRVKVVILAHLYGFLHPDTISISQFCKQHDILLIHDLAQSYGVNEARLDYGDIFYSFGSGKSSTAAHGSIIKKMDDTFYKRHVGTPAFLAELNATFFMKARMYGYDFSFMQKAFYRVFNRLYKINGFHSMSEIQKRAAEYVMKLVKQKQSERRERFNVIARAIENHSLLKVAYSDNEGQYFKCVLFIKSESERFKKYLSEQDVPYFCLYNSIKVGIIEASNMLNFKAYAPNIIEISTEATITLPEIRRVAEIVRNFK